MVNNMRIEIHASKEEIEEIKNKYDGGIELLIVDVLDAELDLPGYNVFVIENNQRG